MKNLVVDIGNTSTKVGIFKNAEWVEEYVFSGPIELEEFISATHADAMIVSSVRQHPNLLLERARHIPKHFLLTADLPLPILNAYATPETLGMDRLAAVCGARTLFPGENCLVVDSGTCITYDFIDATSTYLGGSIAPGLSMRLRAMHEFTAKLPLLKPEEVTQIGNSTVACMQSGALNGMRAEIDGTIERYHQHYPQIRVILCGGDTHFFENSLKGAIFAVQNLVLRGLNSILLHNVSQ
jgi:type III pantothenate kinase